MSKRSNSIKPRRDPTDLIARMLVRLKLIGLASLVVKVSWPRRSG